MQQSIQPTTQQEIIDFWFDKNHQSMWFQSTPEFDQLIETKYQSLWEQAESDQLTDWKTSAQGVLALVIVLDQFPLNMFRNSKKAFATEAMAIELAKLAIANDWVKDLPSIQQRFTLLPLSHSENIADHDFAIATMKKMGWDDFQWPLHHRSIVERFGRFPHRNQILERENTPEELNYLNSDEAFTG